MARFATLVAFITAAATVSTVSAGPVGGPACAAQYKGQPDCVEKCKSSWGFNGGTLGTDRWGPVVLPSGAVDSLNAYIAKACGSTGVPTPTARPTARIHIPAAANAGGAPITETPSPVATSSSVPSSSASPFSAPTILLVAATTSSTPVAPPSSSAEPSSSSPVPVPQENDFRPVSPQEPAPTTSQAPEPPRTTTTQAPTPPPEPTTQAPPPQQTTTQAPAPQPITSPGGSTGGARQEWLDAHNAVRARHGANPVTWGDDLEAAALRWAQNCIWEHSQGTVGGFGENLSAGTGSHAPSAAVNSWAAEVSQYNPSRPQFSHFTQVVWKATTRIGCATFVCNNNMIPSLGNRPITYHVCEYDPPGNMAGEFGQNVQV